MSSIEEQLLRDIEEVTGTVVVSEADLRDASSEVMKRLEDRRQSDHRRGVLVAAAAAAVIVGIAAWQLRGHDGLEEPVGPGPSEETSVLSAADQAFVSGEAPTADLIEGVWRLDNPTDSRMLFMFTSDGEFRWDDAGLLSQNPLVHGSYEIDGQDIVVDVDGGVAACEGEQLVFRAATQRAGLVHMVPVGVGAGECGRPMSRQFVLEQQLPTPEGSDGLTAGPGNNWSPPFGPAALEGVWYVGGGGYLVELGRDGTYSLLAGHGEVVDSGLWTEENDTTRLTLTSTTESPSCEAGDSYVLDDLRAKDLGALVLQGTLVQDDCGLGLPEGKGWFRLAP